MTDLPQSWQAILGDRIEAFEERAAIMQYDGGYEREQSERLAFRVVTGKWAPIETVQTRLDYAS